MQYKSDDEIKEYFELLKQGKLEYREKIILNYMKLVPYIIINKLNLQYDDDYVVEGQIGLIKAVDSFDNKKPVKFSTYASTCIRNQILMYLRKTKRHDNICSIYENIATDEVGNGLTIEETLYDSEYDILEDYLSNETKEEISRLLSFLTEK